MKIAYMGDVQIKVQSAYSYSFSFSTSNKYMKITLPREGKDRVCTPYRTCFHHAGKKTFNGLTVLKEIKEIVSDEDSHLDSDNSTESTEVMGTNKTKFSL